MRVLLINPPREAEIIGNNPAIVEEERGYNPPLGLLYLAGYLRQKTDHAVEVIDAQVEELSYDELGRRVAAARPEVVGLTAMTMTILDVRRTVELVRDLAPGARVVLGGPHVNLFPEESIRLRGVDYLVLGEGEEAFAQLLAALDDPAALAGIPGLVYEHQGRVVNTGPRPAIEDLDAIPFPARDLVPYRRYGSLLAHGEVATTMFTSRGCPFHCAFCDRPHLGKRFRARSAQDVVAELEACLDLGIDEFLIYDDTFTVDKARVLAICDLIVQKRLRLGFDVRARVDTITPEMLAALKRAGCQGIHYGVEAGTPRMLRRLNKGITLEQVFKVFKDTKRAGIPTLAYFMIGNPGETRAEIQETFRVMRRLNPDFVHATILTPFPGTRIYTEALQKGVIDRDVWREFAADPTPDFTPPVWGEHFTREELGGLLKECYQSFYLRPGYVLKRLTKVRSLGELRKKAKAGLGVLKMKARGGGGGGGA